MKVFISLLGFLSFFAGDAAHAYVAKEGNVNAYFGPFMYQTRFPGSSTGARSSILGDVGIVATGDLSSKGSLEIAIFHMNKMFFRQVDGKMLAEKTQAMHITMGYRWWLSEIWSTSLAIYSAYGMDDPQTVHTDFAPGTSPGTSARDTTEYGFDFALQYEMWTSGRYALFTDARYSWNVTKKQNEYGDHYGVMIGVRYFVQEKQVEKRPKQ